ncbi:MAG: calcium/sodium antiporter, partial [Zetaproteobacteria bacterium]|nr:calcium/sodium antiporter [Zetaproteobacteria bacterium]
TSEKKTLHSAISFSGISSSTLNIALAKGSDTLVDGASHLAKRLGVSDLVIGLTVIAIGTSAPEFAVSAVASMNSNDSISLGNVVGSNIFNLGFILSICAISCTITVSKELFYRDGIVLCASASLLIFFCTTHHTISRTEGFIMMLALISYICLLVFSEQRQAKTNSTNTCSEMQSSVLSCVNKIILGLFLLLCSSKALVELASLAALRLGISEWIVGITIVAAGTSLPELMTAITSIAKGKQDIGIGNLIGSDIFNLLGVLGLAACIKPIQISPESYNAATILLFSIVVLLGMMRTQWKLSKREGFILFLISCTRWGLSFL